MASQMNTNALDFIRTCNYCNTPIVGHRRIDARYCDNSCRYKDWLRKKHGTEHDRTVARKVKSDKIS